MADIKFSCPQCQQKIAVDDSAAGVKIDCPHCRSTLVIPPSAEAVVTLVVARQLALVSDQHADLHAALEEQRRQALAARLASEEAKSELQKLRESAAKVLADAEKARTEAENVRKEK